LLLLAVLAAAAVVYAAQEQLDLLDDEPEVSTEIPADAVRATVDRVYDGDTIAANIDGKRETVRLIGIDAPETGGNFTEVECAGPEATAFLRSLLPNDTTIWLERDVSERDRFDRLLFFLWMVDDGRAVLVNEAAVAAGYAIAQVYPPDEGYAGVLAAAEEEARAARLGMWAC
jgi:micrococcal nuclease